MSGSSEASSKPPIAPKPKTPAQSPNTSTDGATPSPSVTPSTTPPKPTIDEDDEHFDTPDEDEELVTVIAKTKPGGFMDTDEQDRVEKTTSALKTSKSGTSGKVMTAFMKEQQAAKKKEQNKLKQQEATNKNKQNKIDSLREQKGLNLRSNTQKTKTTTPFK